MPNKKEEKIVKKVEESKKNEKIQKALLKDAIISVAGKNAEEVINYIDTKNYVNEFLIAKKLGITINQLRNILYKLSDEGIVSSVRKKDKRKGWYTYFWKIEALRTLDFLKAILEKRINQTIYQIDSRERKNFYICETCSVEFNEENALLQDFTCSECGEVFVTKDNVRLLKELRKNFDKQKKGIQLIEEEIIKEKEKLEKKREREIKKEKKLTKKKLSKKKTTKKAEVKKKSVKKPTKKTKKKLTKKVIKKIVQKKLKSKKKTKKSVKPKKKIKYLKKLTKKRKK